jgi:hypothetical protein
MRLKCIFLVAIVAAFTIGIGTADAALQNGVRATAKFKKAGGPGSLYVQLINIDDAELPVGKPVSHNTIRNYLFDGGLVPQPVRKIIMRSRSAQYNRKALPYCNVYFNGVKTLPTRAGGATGAEELTYVPGRSNTRTVARRCPKKSVLGKGTYSAVVGNAGTAYQPIVNSVITGDLLAYNYPPRPGDTMAAVVRIHVKEPVAANQYIYVGVSRAEVITGVIPTRAEIPANLDGALLPGEISVTSMDIKLTAPKPKSKRTRRGRKPGKPIFTMKTPNKLDFYGQIER